MVHGMDAGSALIRHPDVKVIGFSGSMADGMTLDAIARTRPEPILFYGELSGVDPLVITPAAAAERESEITAHLVDPVYLCSDQLCAEHGGVFVPADSYGDFFVDDVVALTTVHPPVTAPTGVIARNFVERVHRLEQPR